MYISNGELIPFIKIRVMAFKRVLVLIQVGVATLHRRQAHEHKKRYKSID